MSALARLEARDAAASDRATDVLSAVAADLRLCGSLTRETIRRVCRAVTPSAGPLPHRDLGLCPADQQLAAPIAPGAAGQEN